MFQNLHFEILNNNSGKEKKYFINSRRKTTGEYNFAGVKLSVGKPYLTRDVALGGRYVHKRKREWALLLNEHEFDWKLIELINYPWVKLIWFV